MIKLHPSSSQLNDFVCGDLPPSSALMLSAHIDMCSCCAKKVAELQVEQAEIMVHSTFKPHTNFGSMLDDIVALPQEDIPQGSMIAEEIDLDGRKFPLPRALRRVSSNIGSWSKLAGRLWQAPVDLGADGRANFIFMEKGSSVPEHSHRGTEMTLVINGTFSDGIHDYDCGDFVVMTDEHKHEPLATSDDGCLVFSVVDKPLHFTSGLARLLNPFSHLFFK